VQNEANFGPATGKRRRKDAQNEPNFDRPEVGDGGNCAKRSQTWADWGMWAKAVVVWGVARQGIETCKTNPILTDAGEGVAAWGEEVRSDANPYGTT
jgi:hypothetical protein